MKIFRRVLAVVFAIIFLLCAVRVGYGIYDKYRAEKEYENSKHIANIPEITMPVTTAAPETDLSPETSSTPTETTAAPEPEPEPDENAAALLRDTDIASLCAKNPDVLGWIVIPDSNISFPLVQGSDNEHYLYHTWEGRWSWSGSIYLDCRVSRDLFDFHTIIYGHNMGGGRMFSDLLFYREQSYYEAHPSIYIVTEDFARRYDIFSAYESDLATDKTYVIGLNDDASKSAYLARCKANSEIACSVTPETEDSVITLSTCTQTGVYDYKTRWVVQATLAYEVTRAELDAKPAE